MKTQVWADTAAPQARWFATADGTTPMACSRCGVVLGAEPFSTGPDGAACSNCVPIVQPTPAARRRAGARTPANRVLARAGLMLVPRPPFSGKALHETANVTEVHHPARGGNATRWLRHVAALTDQSRGRGER
ncbi:hypothetical protein [Actinomadura sp. 3N508]|uniref:hypothetical protein n=1 Tax=Actinomadura sp. 3N508 TaxID=3375153 RepID=UPI00379243B8